MRRLLISVLAALSMLFAGTVLTAPSAAAAPYCGQVWGSLDKGVPGMSSGQLTGVRAAPHTCYDRLVLDVNAPLTAWSVRYVDQIIADGSGNVVPVAGGARLEVVARVGINPYSTWFGRPGTNLVNTSSGFQTFKQVVSAGSFEGVTTVGLGVRARLPFRAFVLPGPGNGSRLVIDVGHYW